MLMVSSMGVTGRVLSELERLADKDEGPLAPDWESTVMVGLPPAKQDIHIRLDERLRVDLSIHRDFEELAECR